MTTAVPTFEFIRAQSGGYHWPKAWTLALAGTGRFFRNARGQILFLASRDPLDEFVMVCRASELQAIVADGEVLKLTGDDPDESEWKFFWYALNDHRFRLPSAGNRAPVTVATVPA